MSVIVIAIIIALVVAIIFGMVLYRGTNHNPRYDPQHRLTIDQRAVLKAVNTIRKPWFLWRLNVDYNLSQLASQRADELLEKGGITHENFDGEGGYASLIIDCGFKFPKECLASRPYPIVPESLGYAWATSEKHDRAIRNRKNKYIGIGVATNPKKTKAYIVVHLAR